MGPSFEYLDTKLELEETVSPLTDHKMVAPLGSKAISAQHIENTDSSSVQVFLVIVIIGEPTEISFKNVFSMSTIPLLNTTRYLQYS